MYLAAEQASTERINASQPLLHPPYKVGTAEVNDVFYSFGFPIKWVSHLFPFIYFHGDKERGQGGLHLLLQGEVELLYNPEIKSGFEKTT